MTRPADGRPALVVLAAGMAKRYGGCKPLAPAGLHGEAVIDLTASDALAAGFGTLIVVLGPHSGPAIAYHVARTWPRSATVHLARQPVPLGTAHAALCAHRFVGDRPFALVNGDDVYGVASLELLAEHLRRCEDHAMVAYALADTVVGADPVTRGTCRIGEGGELVGIDERKLVTREPDGSFRAGDGRQPVELAAGTPVSMNLWGFTPAVWPVLEAAVRQVHPDVGSDGSVPDGGPRHHDEVLLPEVVGAMVGAKAPGGRRAQAVQVLRGEGRCIGVTHAGDLPVVRSELAGMIGHGQRGERLWEAAG